MNPRSELIPISPFEQSISPEIATDGQRTTDQGELPLLALLIAIARRKKLVAAVAGAVALAGVLVAFVSPDYYTARARIMPPQQTESTAVMLMNQLANSGLGSLASLANKDIGLKNPNDMYIGMLRSDTVEESIITKFDLQKLYRKNHVSDAQKELEKATSITSGKDGMINISFESRNPKLSADVANGYIEQLRNLTTHLAVSEASQRRMFFEQQLQQAKEDLANAEVALKETQQKTGMIELDSQSKATIEAIALIKAKMAAKQVESEAMSSFVTDKNPDYVIIQKEIGGLRTQLANLEQSGSASPGDPLVATGKIPAVGMEYIRRFREVKYREAIFELMAKQFEAAKIDEAKEATVIQVVDPARQPDKKSGPHRGLIILGSLFLGIVLGTVCALGADSFHRMSENEAVTEQIAQLKFYTRLKHEIGAGPRS